MNDFNEGYNDFVRGIEFDFMQSMLWKRGWYAAERDLITFQYAELFNGREPQ